MSIQHAVHWSFTCTQHAVPWPLYRPSTCYQFHAYSTPCDVRVRNMSDVCITVGEGVGGREARFASITYGWNKPGSGVINLIPLDGKALALYSMQLLDSFKLRLQSAGFLPSIQTIRKCQTSRKMIVHSVTDPTNHHRLCEIVIWPYLMRIWLLRLIW